MKAFQTLLRSALAAATIITLAGSSEGAVPEVSTARKDSNAIQLPNIGTHWYGAYLGGRKVGHAKAWVRKAEPQEAQASFVVGLEIVMSVKAGGLVDRVRVLDTRIYARTAPYGLVEATYRQESSRAVDVRKLRQKRNASIVERTLNGEPQAVVSVKKSKEVLADQVGAWGAFVRQGLRASKLKGWSFNWASLKDEAYSARILTVDEQHVAGLKTTVAELAVHYESLALRTKVRLLSDGSMLEMNVGPHLILRLEEQSQAKSGLESLDASTAGIKVDKKLGDPSEVSRLSLEVFVPGDYRFSPRGNRTISECKGGRCRLEIVSKAGSLVGQDERDKALQSTPAFDSESPIIKTRAAQVTKGTVGGARVKRLVDYVYGSLRKQLATNLPSASVVMKEGYGDCTEHTWLFVALARAAGIPARPAYGLAYVEGPHRRFAYHAWVEVEIDGRWVEVDPTWGQQLADATHLHLGEDAMSMAVSLGQMEIRVLKIERRSLR
jgi:hypothetical protein